jgi:hypothetical protein
VLAYLLASNLGPGALYVGTPGRRVGQIREEQALRNSIEACLSSDPGKEKGRSWILSQAAVKGSDVAGKRYEPPWQVKAGSAPLIGLAVVLLLAIAIALGLVIHFGSGAGFKRSFVFGLLALVVVTAASALILYELLIRSQASDPSYPNNRFGPHTVPCIAQEDKGVSNHFVSVTKIKPGAFRSLLSRTILFVVKYYTIFFANTGTLSGIPSIHFARWILIEGDTLVFFTNFGGTWDSYLDDFIYRAHTGLTAIWSNSMGFPKTTGLFADGAQQELAFKVYARNSQTPTQVWYQAYPGMSTANIDNNTRIREGLSGNMSAQEEDRWLARL